MTAKRKILVVDDEPAALVLLERRLSAVGYEVISAEDGQVALAEVGRVQPELVILDVMMPRMSGFDVIRDLRSRPETAALPVIAISAQGRGLDRSVPVEQRPDAFFPKPIDFRQLLAEVSRLLDVPVATPSDGPSGGMLLVFIGAKGGVGTTTLAANVAGSLARAQWPTVLVETAAFHGTATTVLDLSPLHRLDDLPLRTPEALTLEAIARTLTPHPSGLRVLFGPSGAQPAPPPEGVTALVDGLRRLARCTVVDLDAAADVFGRVMLPLADRVCVVTHPEPTSVQWAEQVVRTLGDWGIPAPAIRLVVNRANPAMPLYANDIVRQVGKLVTVEIPPAPPAVTAAGGRAGLLVDHPSAGPVRQRLLELTEALLTNEPGAPAG